MENYSPRQRRLRNLVVEDETAAAASSGLPVQTEASAGPADMVNLVIQPEVAGGTGGEQASYPVTDGEVNAEQTDFTLAEREDEVEQTEFTVADVMEQTLLVRVQEAYPINQSDVVVEIPSTEADGKN